MSTVEGEAWHYLKGNTTSRQPRRHIFLDTEAFTTKVGKQYSQGWRCGVAIFRDAPKGKQPKEVTRAYTDLSALWTDVDAFVRPKHRVVLWTHNLGYDVRTSNAFKALLARSWKLIAWNIAPQGTWLVWQHDKRTLTMVDSASVFPTTVAELAKHFQTTKLPLPSNVDSMDRWLARCARDVQIMHDAVVAYLGWLDRENLGTWQLTGTGQAFAAFRHRFLTHPMLVHWDADARSMERRAMWTGRAEAFWHGTRHHTQIDEWDLSACYPRIALHDKVPTQLVRVLSSVDDFERWMGDDDYAVLAEVDVTTEVPLVPTERSGRILWPVGSFTTVLWDPEIRLAREFGASVTFRRGYVYRVQSALQDWAQWILSIVDGSDENVPPWLRLVAQHWSRAVIGRFAMQHQAWELLGETARRDVQWWSEARNDAEQASELVQVGYQLWQSVGNEEWAHGMPAVTGWIMSRGREILTRLWQAMPDHTVLYMDTDSLLVEHHDHRSVPVLAASHMGHLLRLKRSWDRITILGPRQLITGKRVRVAGVPTKAVRMPDGSLRGEVWESLRGALRQGRSGQVRVTPRRWRLRAIDARRVAGPDGWTEPVRLP